MIAAEEILMSKQGMDLIGAAGIKPDELADRFNGETDDPILLGTIIF